MLKKQRKRKISINTMLIFLDIVLLILMIQDIYVKHILGYALIRVILIPLMFVLVNIKFLITFLKFMGSRRIMSRMRKILEDEECIDDEEYTDEDVEDIEVSIVPKIYILSMGTMLLMFLFSEVMYKLVELVTYILDEWLVSLYSPNAHFVLIGVILVNIALESIRYYVNSRCEYLRSLLKREKDVTAQ